MMKIFKLIEITFKQFKWNYIEFLLVSIRDNPFCAQFMSCTTTTT